MQEWIFTVETVQSCRVVANAPQRGEGGRSEENTDAPSSKDLLSNVPGQEEVIAPPLPQQSSAAWLFCAEPEVQ